MMLPLSQTAEKVGIEAALGASPTDAQRLFQQMLTAEFFVERRLREQLRLNRVAEQLLLNALADNTPEDPKKSKRKKRKKTLRQNNRVYNDSVVLWLMIAQRLKGGGTMDDAVLELLRGLPDSFWPKPCKRLQPTPEGEKPFLSENPGSYNNARQELPLTVVAQAFDHVFEQLIARSAPVARRQAFFLDGTTVRMPHNPALCAAYPPARNQRGASHWPILRMLVAHDLYTGLAMRPEWGPVHGEQNVSEQRLVDRCIGRLPDGSLVVGDANFGVFSVAYAAFLSKHPVLLRLTPVRAQSLLGGPLEDGIDRSIVWKSTKADRKSHPELPEDASLEGRLLVRLVQPGNGGEPFLLALFTTLEETADEIYAIYDKRWNIETDLRSLKSTLKLDQLSCASVEMVAKEIDAGMLAYNLVRAIMAMAAEQTGLPPRAFSFTRVRKVMNAFAPLIATAKTQQEADRIFDKMMYYVRRASLRQRKRKSYPRAVWGSPRVFPKREAPPE